MKKSIKNLGNKAIKNLNAVKGGDNGGSKQFSATSIAAVNDH